MGEPRSAERLKVQYVDSRGVERGEGAGEEDCFYAKVSTPK